ncbi:MAG: hypothetical protein KDE23_13085 [Caldilinea sp.]|nr:hypothetical protein [Caldilinea sp.]
MSTNKALQWLIPPIIVLAIIAAGAGLWPAAAQSYPLTNFRGEAVTIRAGGLYYWDTVSSVAQMQANDMVTLVLGVPLLVFSFWLARRGSLRGQLLLAGTLGFFLYTYMSMCFGTAYNPLFLVYVALFGLSLYAFVLAMLAFDLTTLPQHFSERLPRRWIAGLLIGAALFLALAWLGRIAATFGSDQAPPLENVTSMFIQAMDLVLVVPACVLGAVLLLRRSAWGYLLASVAIMKFVTMGTAVSLMGLNMARAGVPVSAAELVIFPAITLVNLVLAVLLLRNVSGGEVAVAPAHKMAPNPP